MKTILPTLTAVAILMIFLTGCDNPPMYGRADSYPTSHLQFGNADLMNATRVLPVEAHQDPAGLLHVSVSIRSTTDTQQYIDAFCTFTRGGQFIEKSGPQTITLKGNLPENIQFTSTQPADDYSVALDYAK